jgi:DNA-binding CsgD family transcriptional regulator
MGFRCEAPTASMEPATRIQPAYDRAEMVGAVPPESALLEREGELQQLSRSLQAAREGNGRFVLVEGSAGVGKTSLLNACAELAVDLGMLPLRVRGDEVAMEFSFAAVRELFSQDVRAARPHLLHGAARLAAPVFGGRTVGARGQADRMAAVLHGLYWLVANLADRAPLALLVDDAHWVDAASGRFLLYLAQRVDSLRVVLAAAVRPGEGTDAAGLPAPLLEVAASVLRVGPLSEAGSEALVRRALGPRADEELCRACHEATGGNPFYLRELTAALKTEAGGRMAEAASRVRSLGAGAVGRSVLVRLSRLGADCERLAQALAVLAPGSPLRHAVTLAGLRREHAEVAADKLRMADLLAPEQALSFVHPIVREAVAAQIPASRRGALHARAAQLLADDGAPSDHVAAHLLFAEPYGEQWVIDALRAAARDALTRGAPEAAVSYLTRALAEPPAPEVRQEVLLELGRAQALLPGDHDFSALRQALELASDPRQRAEIALELERALTAVARNADVAALLEEVLERADELDPELVESMEADLLGAGAPYLPATETILRRTAPHFARARRGEDCDRTMLAALAMTGALAGLPADEVVELGRRALRDEHLLQDHPPAYGGALAAISWADALEEAARAADAGFADAQRRGSAPMFAQMSIWRGAVALRAGELELAEAHCEGGHELARELGAGHFAAAMYIPVLVERSRADEAFEIVQSLQLPEPLLDLWHGVVMLAQRGRVYVARGELERGIADMREADRRMAERGLHLSVVSDWAPTAAIALARVGRDGEARRLAERELEDAVAFGAPRRHGMALSVCGLLDSGERGLARLREAVAELERSPARLEHARALVNLGAGLRERGRREEARESLSLGLDIAQRCGGVALAERAHAELVAAGARPRRRVLSGPESLTPAEFRTARLAAEGLSNREIAESLFVSAKTVEAELSHAYAKLGIASRSELADALSRSGSQNVRVLAGKD